MDSLGRMLLVLGGLVAAVGLVVLLLGRTGLPLGRLPGDLSWRSRQGSVYFPLGTSLLLSVVLSLFFWLIGHIRR